MLLHLDECLWVGISSLAIRSGVFGETVYFWLLYSYCGPLAYSLSLVTMIDLTYLMLLGIMVSFLPKAPKKKIYIVGGV